MRQAGSVEGSRVYVGVGPRRDLYLGLVDVEAELGPILASHQVVVHTAAEVLLSDVAAQFVSVLMFRQAAHILDHNALADAFMIQREAAALGWRRREQFLRERVRGHITPRPGKSWGTRALQKIECKSS